MYLKHDWQRKIEGKTKSSEPFWLDECSKCQSRRAYFIPIGGKEPKLKAYKTTEQSCGRKAGVARRTVTYDIPRVMKPDEIYKMITEGPKWEYKAPAGELRRYYLRDMALCALAFLTGGRILEILKLDKAQVNTTSHVDKGFIVIEDMPVVKRKFHSRAVRKRKEVPLPLKGQLTKFTKLFMKWYNICEGPKLFPGSHKGTGHISPTRAYQIIDKMTGNWCHWFRSMSMSHYGGIITNTMSLADFYGLKNMDILKLYVKSDWETYSSKMLA